MIREWFIRINGYSFINKKQYLYEGNRTSSIIIIELRNTKSNTLIYAPKPTAYIAIASTNLSIFSSYITNRYLYCLPVYYIIFPCTKFCAAILLSGNCHYVEMPLLRS